MTINKEKIRAVAMTSHDVAALKAKPAENYFELACHEYRQQIQSLKAELREISEAIDDPAINLTKTAVECINDFKLRIRLAEGCAARNQETTHICMNSIKALKEELEAVRKDAERLDWLLEHSDATVCSNSVYGSFHVWYRYSGRTADEAPTARGAIDAAIEMWKQQSDNHLLHLCEMVTENE